MSDETITLQNRCTPCEFGAKPLTVSQIEKLMSQVSDQWYLSGENQLARDYKFKNFKQALDFVNQVGDIAEKYQHHPDIFLAWGKVCVTLFTHKIQGLHQNDFVLASIIDKIK